MSPGRGTNRKNFRNVSKNECLFTPSIFAVNIPCEISGVQPVHRTLPQFGAKRTTMFCEKNCRTHNCAQQNAQQALGTLETIGISDVEIASSCSNNAESPRKLCGFRLALFACLARSGACSMQAAGKFRRTIYNAHFSRQKEEAASVRNNPARSYFPNDRHRHPNN